MTLPRGFVKFRRDALAAEMRDRIKKALTVYPIATSSFSESDTVIRMWAEDAEMLAVPRGFFINHLYQKYIDDFDFVPSIGGQLRETNPIIPRPGQDKVIEEACAKLLATPFSGVILQMQTGAGKTPTSLEVARRLGLKVVVVAHNTVLFDQWTTEIEKFFPEWQIGRIQGDRCVIEGKDIVLGTLQSLALKDYPREVYDSFGTLICDEVHICGAPEFSKVFGKFAPKYMIGLTGTLKRKDGAEPVFMSGIGKVISGMKDVEILKPTVYYVDTQFAWVNVHGSDQALDRQKPRFLKSIILSPERNELIIRNALKAADAGRSVLILSERVAHVDALASEIRRRDPAKTVGVLTGSVKRQDREDARNAQILCATVQLLGTGFNEPRLDVLIFATPIQEVTQSVGRILRHHPNKKDPLVIDFVDSKSNLGMILARSRRKKYSEKSWKQVGEEVFLNRRDK